MGRGICHVGTSGWSYPHWAKGRFYPKGLKQGDWLRFFAERFGTVEVNMTFYRLPKPAMVERWRAVTGSQFRFAVKLWRRITHEKRLKDCNDALRLFVESTQAFGPKRAPLLVQLPPTLRQDVDLLDKFLADLEKATKEFPWRVAVEFRNTDWLCDPVYEVLDRHNAALCLADLPKCPISEPNQVDFVYIRRHGPGGGYRGCYTGKHVNADAARIRKWLNDGRDVYVYFNNDIDGYAVDNACQLMKVTGT